MESVHSIILAARPKTLPAAIVPVWLGCLLAWRLTGEFDRFDLWLAICTLMGAISIQISTNFFNDAIDSDKGADTERRLGPVRATASGLLSRRTVYVLASLCLLMAMSFGAVLVWHCGWVIAVIGIPSLYLSYGYTGGPVPLAYRGLGELFVILFFGIIAVMTTVFVQTGEWLLESLLLGLQMGLLSAVLISVNNLRDVEEDTSNEKRTLAVQWGVTAARWIITLEVIFAYGLGWFWVIFDMNLLMWYPLGASLLGVVVVHGIWRLNPCSGYNKFLAIGGVQLMLYGVLFTIACLSNAG